jgi:hypothetical protein
MINDRQRAVYEALPSDGRKVDQTSWVRIYKRMLIDARCYDLFVFAEDRDFLVSQGYIIQTVEEESRKGFLDRSTLFHRSHKKLPIT